MQLLVVAALAAVGAPALAKLNPLDHPTLHARYSPHSARADVHHGNAGPSSGNTTSRYRNANTESYFVSSMPDVNFEFGEMYAGTIPLGSSPATNASASGPEAATNASSEADEMFFIFMPKEGGEPVDELTIWLNGGPGCSSMEGFLQEVGPISWLAGTHAPERNMYAWTNVTNMLYVDQPIGTGYSRGTPSAASQTESAAQFLAFLKKFQTMFGISNFRIFMTGESYAGRYIPYIANAMLDANDTQHFNISGAIIYDGVIGNHYFTQQQVVAYPYVVENWSHFGFKESDMALFKQLHEQCGFDEYLNKYLTFPASGVQPPRFWNKTDPEVVKCDLWNSALIGVLSINPCFDPYETNKPCPILWDVLGMSGLVNDVPPGTTVYFDRPDVKAALHVPDASWIQCSKKPVFTGGGGKGGPGQNGDESPDPIQGVLPRVIDATQRVLIANGDFDFVILTQGSLLSIQNMTWGGQLGFQEQPAAPLFVPLLDIQYRSAFADSGLGIDKVVTNQGHMGVQHYERGLMWNQVWGAGHMLPAFQPRVAYMQLLWMLGHLDSLGPPPTGAAAPGGNGTAAGGGMSGANAAMAGADGATGGGGTAGAGAGAASSDGAAMSGGNNAVGGSGAASGLGASGGNGTADSTNSSSGSDAAGGSDLSGTAAAPVSGTASGVDSTSTGSGSPVGAGAAGGDGTSADSGAVGSEEASGDEASAAGGGEPAGSAVSSSSEATMSGEGSVTIE